jgi:hypothetical protein
MSENMRTADTPGQWSARDDYELEYLARKYNMHARLAKAGRAVELETRADIDESLDR